MPHDTEVVGAAADRHKKRRGDDDEDNPSTTRSSSSSTKFDTTSSSKRAKTSQDGSSASSSAKVCAECGVKKDSRLEFSKNQRRKGNLGVCIPCIQARFTGSSRNATKKPSCDVVVVAKKKGSSNDETNAKTTMNAPTEKTVGGADSKPASTTSSRKVCASCGETKDAHQDFSKKQRKKKNGACVLCVNPRSGSSAVRERQVVSSAEKRTAKEADRKEYFRTFGVGYELEDSVGKGSVPDRASLEGYYKIVYYKSTRNCPQSLDDDEYEENIGRTARGWAQLEMKDWNGKPALYGKYKIDCEPSFGDRFSIGPDGDHKVHSGNWGETRSGSFIENSIGWKSAGYNGFGIHAANEINLVVDVLYEFNHEYKWWENIRLSTDDGTERDDDYCGGILNVTKSSVALRLCPDWLAGNSFRRSLEPLHGDDANAEELMASYKHKASWVTRHLGFSNKVAFLIREYVTPPPIFYLEKGDLLLNIEESSECEWNKTVVFRPMTNDEKDAHLVHRKNVMEKRRKARGLGP